MPPEISAYELVKGYVEKNNGHLKPGQRRAVASMTKRDTTRVKDIEMKVGRKLGIFPKINKRVIEGAFRETSAIEKLVDDTVSGIQRRPTYKDLVELAGGRVYNKIKGLFNSDFTYVRNFASSLLRNLYSADSILKESNNINKYDTYLNEVGDIEYRLNEFVKIHAEFVRENSISAEHGPYLKRTSGGYVCTHCGKVIDEVDDSKGRPKILPAVDQIGDSELPPDCYIKRLYFITGTDYSTFVRLYKFAESKGISIANIIIK